MDTDGDETDGENKLADGYLERGYSIRDFDPTLDKVIKGRLNVDDVIKRHRRVRRSVTKNDTIEHVTKIMESIEEELDDLKVTFPRIAHLIRRDLTLHALKCHFINSKLKFVIRPRQKNCRRNV